MSLAELVITSVKVEGRSKSEVARDYKISRYWSSSSCVATKPRATPRSSRGREDLTATPARSASTWKGRSPKARTPVLHGRRSVAKVGRR